jgi:DNA mismatch endonuclease (patch repair protein)
MTDTLTPERRSWNMSRIRGSDTGPEKIVRSALHRMGLRFRLHRKDLPGRPDIVLPALHTVVFVHGCYWHRHPGCRFAYSPKTRVEFWQAKFQDNVERDSRQQAELEAAGWRVVIVWECSTSDPEQLASELQSLAR